jgi:chromosome segregation ATPase
MVGPSSGPPRLDPPNLNLTSYNNSAINLMIQLKTNFNDLRREHEALLTLNNELKQENKTLKEQQNRSSTINQSLAENEKKLQENNLELERLKEQNLINNNKISNAADQNRQLTAQNRQLTAQKNEHDHNISVSKLRIGELEAEKSDYERRINEQGIAIQTLNDTSNSNNIELALLRNQQAELNIQIDNVSKNNINELYDNYNKLNNFYYKY